MNRLRLTVLMAAVVGLGPAALAVERPVVTLEDQIEFEQQKATAHMRELEERMFRLSELVRESEPDHGARLVLALQKAREELILEQMGRIRRLITDNKLEDAAFEQGQVIRKLDELRELLLSADLDLTLKLERLRKLNAAIEKLGRVIAEEKQQRDRVGDAVKEKQKSDLVRRLDQLKADQRRNRTATDLLRADVKSLVPSDSPAPEQLGRASQSMESAESSLGAGDAAAAQDQQSSVIDQLERARQELIAQREQVLEELQERVRAEVMDALVKMLEKQKRIRQSTEAQSDKVQAGDREAVLVLKRLSVGELGLVELADKTIWLVEQTDFSVAMPYALRSVRQQMRGVAGHLRAGRANHRVVEAERQIENQLAELLEVMEKQQDVAARAGRPSRGGCKACNARSKLLAELKMIRMMQVRLNDRTRTADARRPEEGEPLSDELGKEIKTLHNRQAEMRDATMKLHHRSCARCVHEH